MPITVIYNDLKFQIPSTFSGRPVSMLRDRALQGIGAPENCTIEAFLDSDLERSTGLGQAVIDGIFYRFSDPVVGEESSDSIERNVDDEPEGREDEFEAIDQGDAKPILGIMWMWKGDPYRIILKDDNSQSLVGGFQKYLSRMWAHYPKSWLQRRTSSEQLKVIEKWLEEFEVLLHH